MKTRLLWLCVAFVSCGRAEPVPTPVPATQCLSEELREFGTPALPSRHLLPCCFRQRDDLGPIARGSNVFDANERPVTQVFERLDDPPRTTVYDYTFVIGPRKSLTTTRYDAAGRTTYVSVDNAADGTIESEGWWTFDTVGRELTTRSRNDDRVWSSVKTWDSSGFVLSDETSEGRRTVWTRRENGAPLTETRFNKGVIEQTQRWTYDLVTGVLRASEIANATGKVTERSTFDENGRLIGKRSGWSATTEQIQTLTWDERGNLLRDHRVDSLGHEIEDLVLTWDSKNRELTRWHRWGYSLIGGPRTDFDERTLGSCGEPLSGSRTSDGKLWSTYSVRYDAAGHAIGGERRTFAPSELGFRSESTFDAFGHLVHTRTENLSNGTWVLQSERERRFDLQGHLLLDQTTGSAGDVRQTWTFDAAGDLTASESNANFGKHEDRTEFDYSCF